VTARVLRQAGANGLDAGFTVDMPVPELDFTTLGHLAVTIVTVVLGTHLLIHGYLLRQKAPQPSPPKGPSAWESRILVLDAVLADN